MSEREFDIVFNMNAKPPSRRMIASLRPQQSSANLSRFKGFVRFVQLSTDVLIAASRYASAVLT